MVVILVGIDGKLIMLFFLVVVLFQNDTAIVELGGAIKTRPSQIFQVLAVYGARSIAEASLLGPLVGRMAGQGISDGRRRSEGIFETGAILP